MHHLEKPERRLRAPLRALAVAGVAGVMALSATASHGAQPLTSKRDKDCTDFPTQAAAQHYLDTHGPGDPNGLDSDGDGVACESNPCPCAGEGGDGGLGQRRHAVVAKVADGDTIDVRLKGRRDTVRLIGIDTPEVYFGAECGGAQASASMHHLLKPGERVRLIRDRSQANRDRYGRLLRYVQAAGRDVGRAQVRRGWASVYVFDAPFARVESYRRARGKAKHADRGVWRRCGGDFHEPLKSGRLAGEAHHHAE
jgi:endonuclease YncB( thermonuclease family)